MEVYRTKDGQVSKYVHDDGSETAIKTISSCDNSFGVSSDKVRQKYSVFISISVGCKVKCGFCYLTSKNYPYHELSNAQVLQNVLMAIEEEVKHNPDLKDKYIKLGFMGMGDAFPYSAIVYNLTFSILDYVMKKGYAKGLDGVDLATSYPSRKNFKSMYGGYMPIQTYPLLNARLKDYPYNPNHSSDRSRFRLFYSLHSVKQDVRSKLIPKSENMHNAIDDLQTLNKLGGIDLIYHYMFLNGVNDSDEDVNVLIDFMNGSLGENAELRILRYNECEKSIYQESVMFTPIVKKLSINVNKLKYQISTGSAVKAACGMFLMKKLKDNK